MKQKSNLILDNEFLQYCELNGIEDIDKLAKETFKRGFTILKYGETPFGKQQTKEVIKEELVEKIVEIGSPVTRQRELIEMGNCVNAKSLDNRVSVFILIETLKKLKGKKIPYTLNAVFTVQEEVGIRGANVSALEINPDFGIGLDTTIAYDLPGAPEHEKITSLGKGVAIKIMDSSTICDTRMVKFMKQTADKNKIKWQPEILTGGGTDTAGIQRSNAGGSIAGCISIPTRHIHQVIEMSDKNDIQGAIDLLTACIKEMDTFDWTLQGLGKK